jgi:hypothetical protein
VRERGGERERGEGEMGERERERNDPLILPMTR